MSDPMTQSFQNTEQIIVHEERRNVFQYFWLHLKKKKKRVRPWKQWCSADIMLTRWGYLSWWLWTVNFIFTICLFHSKIIAALAYQTVPAVQLCLVYIDSLCSALDAGSFELKGRLKTAVVTATTQFSCLFSPSLIVSPGLCSFSLIWYPLKLWHQI